MRSDTNGSVPELLQIGLAFTRAPMDPNPLRSSVGTQVGSLSKVILLGFDPKMSRVSGWDLIQTETDRKCRDKTEKH